MTSRPMLIVAVAVVLVALVAWWLVRGGGNDAVSPRPRPGSGSSVIAGTVDPARASQPADATPLRRPAHTAAERAALVAAITAARTQRTAAPPRPASASGGELPTSTTLDITDRTGDTSAWQKRTLGTLNALLGECYDLGRAEDPNLEGTVMLRFTLAGEPKVGGVLEHVELVDEHTSIQQATLRDCMTESLYALELDPPPEGMRVERELSMKFP